MAQRDRAALTAAIGAALADLQAAYDDRDRAMAEALGINRTDLRCLDLIVRGGPRTATELAARMHLTRGSMTTLIDRLEAVGYVQRQGDPQHGRRKLIVPTAALMAAIHPLLKPAIENGQARLAKYTDAELRLILGFLRETHDGQGAVIDAIRGARRADRVING
ncbi:MarR family winged helix-turn-helix transcriptional regulator [Actinocrinis sp.]|uniref:MarR family winged helix-turn-helix transcriptional regulator n=1 Tax=Actinocrinis sp. TaxID=1920516 RepID=UPI002D6685F7|nr:MarR family transcriptional regulator [Actinocrinis sp.]HZP49886.1 MarR family transcriptional regulator [Actinocrinis sp.]